MELTADKQVVQLLHLADNALVLGHRNSEWCGHGPVLEQDIAITNISLDLIGQARNFYQHAASLMGDNATEDSLAYHRDASEFRNFIMMELPKGDWAFTILRLFFFSEFQALQFRDILNSKDSQVAAIAEKSLKEIQYHSRWSSEWVIRLADGTDESRRRIENALQELWPFTNEFFTTNSTGTNDNTKLRSDWTNRVKEVFDEGGLELPAASSQQFDGINGHHTAALHDLLTEMQVLPRTYPDATW